MTAPDPESTFLCVAGHRSAILLLSTSERWYTMADAKRYRAFISYSQQDKRWAKRLHSALEAYRLPKGMAADLGPRRKLGRFFRDDEEMGAATDLGAALRGSITDAESLVVVCSPRSAQSKWVNEEIIHFKRTGRADRVFAV